MGGYQFSHEGKAFTPDADPVVEATPEQVEAHNRELAQLEVEAFKNRTADRWFAYWRALGVIPATIGTWTGQLLARVIWKGREYSSPAFGGFPSRRINFRATGIDGRTWAGTYYTSSGDYVRMRVVKEK